MDQGAEPQDGEQDTLHAGSPVGEPYTPIKGCAQCGQQQHRRIGRARERICPAGHPEQTEGDKSEHGPRRKRTDAGEVNENRRVSPLQVVPGQ